MFRLRSLAVLALLTILAAIAVLPASAHASVVFSNPAANAILEQPPGRVTITFSEPVEPGFSRIRVLRSDGVAVDKSDTHLLSGSNTGLSVSLDSLDTGTYTVAWRALSAVDGHLTEGSFPFSVGQAGIPLDIAAPPPPPPSPIDVLGRWLTFLGEAALAGGVIFRLLVVDPALELLDSDAALDMADEADRRVSTVALLASGVLLLGALLNLLGQAVMLSSGVGELGPALLRLLSTRYGVLWLLRVLSIVGVAVLFRRQAPPVAGWRWLSGLGLALGAILTVSLTSHSAAVRDPVLPVAADWAHQVSASVWAGGLLQLALLWIVISSAVPEQHRPRFRSALVMYFSALAAGAVSVLLVTGLYASSIHIGSWDALIHTRYGQTLVLKVSLVLLILALGAMNLLYFSPRLKRSIRNPDAQPTSLLRHFQQAVLAEVALMAAILLTTGLLTDQQRAVEAVASGPQTLTLTRQAGDPGAEIRVQLILQRLSAGQVAIDVEVKQPDGQPITNATGVSLRFSPLGAEIGASSAEAQNVGGGHYRVNGGYLGLTGAWQVEVATRRPDAYDTFAAYRVMVQPGGQLAEFQANGASASPTAQWLSVYGRALIAAASLLSAIAWAYLSRQAATSRPVWLLLFIPALLALVFGTQQFQTFLKEYTPSATLINPTLPDEASISRGKALYQTSCEVCHGPTGHGDGPGGAGLNPPPADFTGGHLDLHTDGDIYYWVQHGIPGSAMPAWEGKLTPDETWDLVNYVRRLRAGGQ